MSFTGWPAAALDFYRGLEADNSKAYWADHKPVYDETVLAPMQALLAELTEEFGESKIFRPNRDIRFSADKSPYKTQIGATLRHGGYVQFSAEGLAAGAGYYRMAPDQLDRYREAVAADRTGNQLRAAIGAIESRGIGLHVSDALKTAPRGFAADHPRVDLLRNKNLAAWRQWPLAGWLHTPGAAEHVVGFFHDARPLVDWLDANVGPTTMAMTRGR